MKSVTLTAIVIAAGLTVGCGPGELRDLGLGVGGPAYGTVRLSVQWPAEDAAASDSDLLVAASEGQVSVRRIPAYTEAVYLRITAADIASPIEETVSKADTINGQATIEVRVPAGTGRLLHAEARDATGGVLAEGSATFDVAVGRQTTVPVELTRGGAADSNWPVWGGGLPNSRLSAQSTGNAGSWSGLLQPGNTGGIGGIVVGTDGTRYFGYSTGASSGGVAAFPRGVPPLAALWKRPFPRSFAAAPAVGGDGTIYAVGNSAEDTHALYRLDPLSGAAIWAKPGFGRSFASPAIGPDGTVFVATELGKVLRYDGETGEELESFPTDGAKGVLNGHPTIGPDYTVYACDASGHMYAFDGRTPDEHWAFDGDGTGLHGPALGGNGLAYCTSEAGRVFAVNMADGSQAWVYPSASGTVGAGFDHGPAIGADGTVFVGDSGARGRFYALGGDDGSLVWRQAWAGESLVARAFTGSPCVSPDGVLFAPAGTRLWVLDAATGTVEAGLGVADQPGGDPMIDEDGLVLCGEKSDNGDWILVQNQP